MVMQDRKINGLSTDLSIQKSETASAESDARSKDVELASKDKQLRSAQHTVGIQAALEKARKEFSAKDAEAYQQGGSLVIRLKTVNFASGRSDLPQKSIPILAKVSDVAKELGAARIRVEGHTDSVGGKAKNQTLSEKRASAVATYFRTSGLSEADVTSEGFGRSKPLASNKSSLGRAENRRVDVVITPEATAGQDNSPNPSSPPAEIETSLQQ
jgi:outer membrane protein OmpA-like peptidoglycan-associated protein